MIGLVLIALLIAAVSNVADGFRPIKNSVAVTKSSLSMAGGFGAKKATTEDDVTLGAPKDTSVSCACGSGKAYSACCQPAHDGTAEGLSPTQVLRARFAAFSYGVIPYIMDSSHPSFRDYVPADEVSEKRGRSKRDIWAKSLTKFVKDYKFSNLSFDNEEVEGNPAGADVALVSIKLDRKLRKGYTGTEKLEEKTKFKKSDTGEWLYLDAASTVLGQELKPGIVKPSSKNKLVNNQSGVISQAGKGK